jgi:nucleolin
MSGVQPSIDLLKAFANRYSRYLLRRTAARAIASSPSTAFAVKPRSLTTIAPAAFRPGQQKWIVSSFQKRFASDDVGFSQTATEAPVDENLSPAQAAAQADPTDAANTVGVDSLEQAAESTPGMGARRRSPSNPPNNTLYVGNLYYEVTTEQLQRVFSRFGEVENVKIVYDNRGLSRG